MKAVKFLLLFVFGIQCSCATIIKEEWEELSILTQPAGAVVTLSNGVTCHTPCNLELERGDSFSLKISKPGFKDYTENISGSSWDAWLLGNVVFLIGLPIAVGVDFYNGYAYDFSPDKLDIKLEKQ